MLPISLGLFFFPPGFIGRQYCVGQTRPPLYFTLETWFDETANFSWKNCRMPSNDSLPDKTENGLSERLTRQINPSQVVVILGGIYAAHSAWIEYEINEANRPDKPIVGVNPQGHERVPQLLQDASWCPMVGWNSASVVAAARELSWEFFAMNFEKNPPTLSAAPPDPAACDHPQRS